MRHPAGARFSNGQPFPSSRGARVEMKKLVFLATLLAFPALCQQFESDPYPKGEPRPTGYLAANEVDYRYLLAVPPPPASVTGDEDRRVVEALQVSGGLGLSRVSSFSAYVVLRKRPLPNRTHKTARRTHRVIVLTVGPLR